MNPRLPWLLIYVFANIIATCIMLESGELIGDLSGNPLYSHSAVIFAATLVVASYLLILGPLFYRISKIKIASIKFKDNKQDVGERIGRFLIFLQIGFMIFNLTTGVNIAGDNNTKTNSLFSLVWMLIPADALFIIYYGFYRDNRYFYPNLFIWMISNISRGWASVFIFILFFEWCRAYRKNKITVLRTIVTGLCTLIFYPLITNLKFFFRSLSATGFSISSLSDSFQTMFGGVDYFSLIGDGITHMVGRLQVTSVVSEVIRLSPVLQQDFAKGAFTPFWLEGLHGLVLEKLFIVKKTIQISAAFTNYENFDWLFNVGDWNINIGYVSWFFIAPYLIPFYILYTLFLGFISFFLVKKIGISESSKDMLWIVWLLYLMAPWLNTFVAFLYALFVFLAIKYFFTRVPRRRFF